MSCALNIYALFTFTPHMQTSVKDKTLMFHIDVTMDLPLLPHALYGGLDVFS